MSENSLQPVVIEEVAVRPFEAADTEAVQWLYENGLLEGQIPMGDTGADIDNIEQAYIEPARNGFWVAEYGGEIVGMVCVAEGDRNLAEIRRLRVQPDRQRQGIGIMLMEQAVQFCHHHGYLKVVLDTRIKRGPAEEIFDKFAFQHNRTKEVNGKELLEFYLDLYREVKNEE